MNITINMKWTLKMYHCCMNKGHTGTDWQAGDSAMRAAPLSVLFTIVSRAQ